MSWHACTHARMQVHMHVCPLDSNVWIFLVLCQSEHSVFKWWEKKTAQSVHHCFLLVIFPKSSGPAPYLSPSPNRDTDKGRRVKGANEKVCVVPLGYYAFKSLNQVNNKMPMEASVNGEKTAAQTMEGSISGWKSITEPVLGIEICGFDSLKSDLQGGR